MSNLITSGWGWDSTGKAIQAGKKPATSAASTMILREAAEHVSERGLAKGTTRNSRGEVCALGALGWAMRKCQGQLRPGDISTCWLDSLKDYHEAVDRLTYSLRERGMLSLGLPVPTWNVVQWNDLPSTTKEDLILALKIAAEG